jgi:8-oxo-dGTP pyrophosphatase MutT (NUDIX family)
VYDAQRQLTGRLHLRGTPWAKGDYGLIVCVWVYDGKGRVLMTQRAKEKTFAGTWENSGGAAKAGEDSLSAIVRELYEETGIRASGEEFEYLGTDRDRSNFFDHYCLKNSTPIDKIVLQPGETDAAKWVTFSQVHQMIAARQICAVIAGQFLRQEQQLLKRQSVQE